MKNYYVILGIDPGANPVQIKKAYRLAAKKKHPDLCPLPDSESQFCDVKEAYDTLSDETRRRRYDAQLQRQERPFRRPAEPMVGKRPGRAFDSAVDEFFKGFVPGFFSSPARGPLEKDLYLEVVLSEAEARRGGLFEVSLPVYEYCPQCAGSLFEGLLCPVCGGNGRVRSERRFSLGIPPRIPDGTRVCLSMEDIGLKGARLHVLVRVGNAPEQYM